MKRLIQGFAGILLAALFLLAGCGAEEVPEGAISLFYLNRNETKIESSQVVLQETELEKQVAEVLLALGKAPEKSGLMAPMGYEFGVIDYTFQMGRLTLNLSKEYYNLSPTTEVLVRAALVESLTQIPEVEYITILVEGERLTNYLGETIGTLTKENFIHNDGNDINTYEPVRIKLFFANEEGDRLVATFREKHYSTNTPLERFVVEELIAGPSGQVEGIFPVINPETRIINVMTKDNICYVNLNSAFLTAVNNVSLEMAAYALANSLTELNTVTSIQILVNGEVPDIFKNPYFEKNGEIVTNLK